MTKLFKRQGKRHVELSSLLTAMRGSSLASVFYSIISTPAHHTTPICSSSSVSGMAYAPEKKWS
jgi:hypothetical protein